jgi:hypothetical protein
MKSPRLHRTAASLAVAASLLGGNAFAADNNFDPRVEVGATHNSNLRLRAAPFDSKVSGGYADVSAVLSTRTQTTTFVVTPRVHATKYTNQHDEETTDWSLNSVLAHQAERSRYGLNASASRQDLVETELLGTSGGQLGTPGSGDGGIAQVTNKVRQALLAPNAVFVTGERSELQLDAAYSDVNYSRTVAGSQVDYSNLSGSVGWSVRASERVRVLTAVNATRFDPDTGGLASNSYGARIEAWREQTERVKSYIRLGATRSSIDQPTSSPVRHSSATTLTAGLGVERSFPTGRMLFQLNRAIDTSGAGQLIERSEGYLELARRLSPRTQFNFGVRAVWAQAVDNSSGYRDQRYYVASGGLEWRLRRTFSLTGELAHTNQRYDGIPGTDSNSVQLGLVYEPNRRE